jgi:hypothetical protein
MKVIGRDIWIGIWALILSVVSVMFWETSEGEKKSTVGGGIIWERFPKFVLGFLAASLIMSFVSTMVPGTYLGKANLEGKFKNKEYKADFSQYQIPPQYADRIKVDAAKGVVTVLGLRILLPVHRPFDPFCGIGPLRIEALLGLHHRGHYQCPAGHRAFRSGIQGLLDENRMI